MSEESASSVFQAVVDTRRQFASAGECRGEFLVDLRARQGRDLTGPRPRDEISAAEEYTDAGGAAGGGPESRMRRAWFEEFERRSDVLKAVRRFLADRGLSPAGE